MNSFVRPDGGYPIWCMTSVPTHLSVDQQDGEYADYNWKSMLLKDSIL